MCHFFSVIIFGQIFCLAAFFKAHGAANFKRDVRMGRGRLFGRIYAFAKQWNDVKNSKLPLIPVMRMDVHAHNWTTAFSLACDYYLVGLRFCSTVASSLAGLVVQSSTRTT